jgi:hypothetical protein
MDQNSIATKSIGELVDSLITTDLRCWFAQETLMDKSLSVEDRLAAAERAQEMNSRRTQLMMAINEFFGQEGISLATKSYHTYLDKK